jgi:hypothetical protein
MYLLARHDGRNASQARRLAWIAFQAGRLGYDGE